MIYDLSDKGGLARDYALKDQMRRSAISIMSNIAEGFESRTRPLFIDYLGRAKASAGELRAQLYLAHDRRYLSDDDFDEALRMAETCSRLIAGLVRYLKSQPAQRFAELPPQYTVD